MLLTLKWGQNENYITVTTIMLANKEQKSGLDAIYNCKWFWLANEMKQNELCTNDGVLLR